MISRSELGFELFQRTAKSLNLTDAGRVFLKEARAVLQRADEAVKNARAVSLGSGELHVGYAPSPTARFSAADIARVPVKHAQGACEIA